MEPQIQAILIDVDNCVVPTDGILPRGFFDGLKTLALFVDEANDRRFPPIGWCSGRDRNYIEAVSFFTGLPNCWSVIESGIALFNPTTKKMILNPALTPEIKEAFGIVRRERLPRILTKFPGLFDYPGNVINIALERQYGVRTPIEDYYMAVKQELRDLEERGLVTIHHSRIAVDISPPGIDKASGVKFLSQCTKIDPEQMLGIGDSRGDFPMLDLVGYAACPANASEECEELIRRKKHGYVSPHPYVPGVVDSIRKFDDQIRPVGRH